MLRIKRTIVLILIFTAVFQINNFDTAMAAEVQTPPSMLRVDPKNEDEPAIGYNEFDQYYVVLKWNVSYPGSAISGYVNFILRK